MADTDLPDAEIAELQRLAYEVTVEWRPTVLLMGLKQIARSIPALLSEVERRRGEDAAAPRESARNVEARFLLDAVQRAMDGQEVGDFAESFPVVAEAQSLASRCASAECARDDHRATIAQHEKDWHALMLLIAEVTGEEDPAAAVDDGFDPWTALRKVAPPAAAPRAETTTTKEDHDG